MNIHYDIDGILAVISIWNKTDIYINQLLFQ